MNRQIKFRGKASNILYSWAHILHKKGDWLYGDLIHQDGKCFIAEPNKRFPLGTDFMSFSVDSNTVSQFTGLKDKNGVDIYENDIIELDALPDTARPVIFQRCAFGYKIDLLDSFIPLAHMEEIKGDENVDWVVLGNRFDNPELLTDKK